MFSPIILDQIDSDQCYLEGPIPVELNMDLNQTNSNSLTTNTSTTQNGSASQNGQPKGAKIVGNDFSNYQFTSLI